MALGPLSPGLRNRTLFGHTTRSSGCQQLSKQSYYCNLDLQEAVAELPTPLVVGGAVGVVVAGVGLYKLVNARRTRSSREAIRERRRQVSRAAIADLAKRLEVDKRASEDQERIVALPLPKLCDELKQGGLKASDVLRAYQVQALRTHAKTNCLVEPVKEAGSWATDRDHDSTKSPKGLLHGVPVSVKEYFGIKGYDGSLAILNWINKPVQEDSVLIKVLKKQGAVPFVRTNVPHMGFGYVTWNPIWGRTSNPLDISRSPGGSSGGESALLAGKGSPLGWGSDVGGSIRNPAHFCGLVGLKPTGNRISSKGTYNVEAIANTMPIVLGPMARDVDSLVLGMRAVLCDYMFALDRSVPPIPFREEIYSDHRPLKIGFYLDNGIFTPVPSCQRAVMMAKTVLTRAGHKVVPWQIPLAMAEQASDLAIKGKIFFADKGVTMMKILEGDKPDDNIAEFVTAANMPTILKRILILVLKFMDKEMSKYVRYSLGAGSVAEWWSIVEEVQVMRRAFEAEWEQAGIDALVCPAFSCPAMPLNQMCPHRGEGSDLQIYNVMDVPGGVVPITTVTDEDIIKMKDYPDHNEAYQEIIKGMNGSEGLPVGVQVITPRYTEELCLRIMKDIESGVSELQT